MNDKKDTKKSPAADTKKSPAVDPKKEADPAPAESSKKAAGGMSRRMFYIVLILAISFAVLIWRQYMVPTGSPSLTISQTSSGKPKIGGPFNLVDQDGKAVTEADFKGRFMLVYFGYTFCPDVCPTSLSAMADALDMLGDKADKIVPVFITVDPERDTPEQMKMYVKYFHPRLVGLSGTVDQVAAAANAYKAYFARASEEGEEEDEYLMDHSSITYLMGPDGQFVSHFSHGVDGDEMAKRLEDLL